MFKQNSQHFWQHFFCRLALGSLLLTQMLGLASAVMAARSATPVVININPNSGADNALNNVTIRGANFEEGVTASLGDTPLADVSRVSSSEILAQVPLLPAGSYNVQVCNPGNQCGTLFNGYTVVGTGPTLRTIIPTQGYNDVPNDVVLFGFNFQPGVSVRIGDQVLNSADVVRVSSTQVRAVVPDGLPAGLYDVIVQNPGSATPAVLANAYTVLAPAGDDFLADSEDLWTSPPTIRQGDTVDLGLNVHRKGGKSTLQVDVAFYLQAADGAQTLIGRQKSAPIPPGPETVEAVFIAWDTTGLDSAVQVVAVIENSADETTKQNNTTSRYFTILPPAADTTPPEITRLLVNDGAAQTAEKEINVTIDATDRPTGPVATMYLVEREFNSSARQWVAIQQTDWIPYQNPYPWTLTDRGGVRYIQAWVSDGAGNISEATIKTRIDYVPPTDSVRAGQVRLYRREVTAGQRVTVQLQPQSGDADLYVWQPDGNRSYVSNEEGTATDSVSFTAEQSGVYQVEVYGFATSTYRLSIVVQEVAQQRLQLPTITHLTLAKEPRARPIIAPTNEPAGNAAVPQSPVTVTAPPTFSLYLPTVRR